MNEQQLNRLRQIEEDLLHLQRAQTQLAVRTDAIHNEVCELLLAQLARPLT